MVFPWGMQRAVVLYGGATGPWFRAGRKAMAGGNKMALNRGCKEAMTAGVPEGSRLWGRGLQRGPDPTRTQRAPPAVAAQLFARDL